MNHIFKAVDRLARILGIISMALVVFMCLFIVAGIVGRVAFKAPISGSYEVVQIALALMFFASFSYTQVRRRHVCISMLIKMFPDAGRYIDCAVVSALGAAISTVLAVAFFQQGVVTFANGQCTQTLFIPMYPVYYISCVMMAVFALTLYVDIVKAIMAACGNEDCRNDLKRSWV